MQRGKLSNIVQHQPLREAAVLLVLVMAVTAVSWSLRHDRLPLLADPDFYQLELNAPLIDPGPALVLYDEGIHLFIDTRPLPEGTVPTIPGAMVIRQDSFDDDLLALFDFLHPEDPLILFGDGNLLAVSNLAALLQERGYNDIQILRGGIKAWIRAQGPTTTPAPQRQDS